MARGQEGRTTKGHHERHTTKDTTTKATKDTKEKTDRSFFVLFVPFVVMPFVVDATRHGCTVIVARYSPLLSGR
jgi:hypothetical protein